MIAFLTSSVIFNFTFRKYGADHFAAMIHFSTKEKPKPKPGLRVLLFCRLSIEIN